MIQIVFNQMKNNLANIVHERKGSLAVQEWLTRIAHIFLVPRSPHHPILNVCSCLNYKRNASHHITMDTNSKKGEIISCVAKGHKHTHTQTEMQSQPLARTHANVYNAKHSEHQNGIYAQ